MIFSMLDKHSTYLNRYIMSELEEMINAVKFHVPTVLTECLRSDSLVLLSSVSFKSSRLLFFYIIITHKERYMCSSIPRLFCICQAMYIILDMLL